MRSETEMLELILRIARGDERIRAVILNGSRANPNAPRDIFQDYDVVYYVTEMAPFVNNRTWTAQFGELMILQMPDAMGEEPLSPEEHFAYLMQFADGSRIDLGICPLEKINRERDSLSILLLDKDGLCQPLPLPSDSDYLPKPPTEKQFADCCNEFWWVCPYVAKGLWREELTYAKYMLDVIVREQLMKMLAWRVGVQTGFQGNPGYHGKFLRSYLAPEEWSLLEKTYAGADVEENWQALLVMGHLFRATAAQVAGHFGYRYNSEEDHNVSAHIEHVRRLPKDAKEIY